RSGANDRRKYSDGEAPPTTARTRWSGPCVSRAALNVTRQPFRHLQKRGYMLMRNLSARRTALIPLVLLLLSASAALAAESRFTFDSTPGQLPKTVVPSHYNIRLKPDLKTLTFEGTEAVDIEVRKATRIIVLN